MSSLVPFGNFDPSAYGFSGTMLDEGFTTYPINNRITLKNGHFRMLVGGEEVQATPGPINVIIQRFNVSISRKFYAAAYDPKADVTAPDCYSDGGVTPAADARNPQAVTCAMCTNNIKGPDGNKKCSSFKRICVTLAEDPSMTLYQMDIPGLSMFGDDLPNNNKFNFRNYATLLSKRGAPPDAVVTQISSDLSASVTKMLFTPIGMIDVNIYSARKAALDNEAAESYTRVEVASKKAQSQLGQGGVGTSGALPQLTGPQHAAQPMTAQPMTAQPMTAQPMTAQPMAAQPMAAQPMTAQPMAAPPVLSQPMTAPPVTAPSITAQPMTAQPMTAQPAVGQVVSVSDLLADLA